MTVRWRAVPDEWDDFDELEAEERAGAARPLPQRGKAWVPLGILIIGLGLLLYSMQLGSVTTSGYDKQRFEAERNEWRQRNEQLELELAKVQSLAWIEVEATQRLGMRRAERVTYLEIAPPAPPANGGQGSAPSLDARPTSPTQGAEGVLGDVLAVWRGLLGQVMPPLEARP